MALRSLGSLLSRTLKRHGVEHGVEAAQLIKIMENILIEKWGDIAKRGIKVRFFRDKAIYLSCTSSVLAQEVRLKEKSLLERVRSEIGQKPVVERIRFVA